MPTNQGHEIKEGITCLHSRTKHGDYFFPESLSSENDILIYMRAQTKKKKPQTSLLLYYICLRSPNWFRKSWILVLTKEDTDLESMVQGNPSAEETDSTRSNLGYHYANRKTFSKEK